MAITKLGPTDLRRHCDPDTLGFSSTEELLPIDELVWQERAIRALRVGVSLHRPGYNVFVAGQSGSGRRTLVRRFVDDVAAGRHGPDDLCYVHNFEDPWRPIPLQLPPGHAVGFARDLELLVRDVRRLADDAREEEHRAASLVRNAVGKLAAARVEEIGHRHRDSAAVRPYLAALQARLVEEVSAGLPWEPHGRYAVQIMATHQTGEGAPVIVEAHPTLKNLFGRVERRARLGVFEADVGSLRPGALHRANGGFLVIPDGAELCKHPDAYDALKRSLGHGTLTIEDPDAGPHGMSIEGLAPIPVPLEVKVIVLGSPGLYFHMLSSDEDFQDLFKVKVELDDRMERSSENVRNLARFVAGHCRKESLRPADASAVARLVDHASELVDDRGKLTTRLSDIADVVREADLWAASGAAVRIGADHVIRALDERRHRVDLYEDRIQEWMSRGIINVDLGGEVVGQVNGLSVIDLGDHVFARPSRITASLGPGREGVLDIERESELGGPLHTKGMLILQGYLQHLLGWDEPVSLRASLCFEQSYGPVDGDSASVAELCVILSALAEVPIRQSLAITGSLSQRGDVQAIGDVCCKVEGFFRACRAAGALTGRQGVIIPAANLENLLVSRELCESAARGEFNLWAVDRVEEALALLTGDTVGEPSPEGFHPRNSILAKAQRRLRLFAERLSRMKD